MIREEILSDDLHWLCGVCWRMQSLRQDHLPHEKLIEVIGRSGKLKDFAYALMSAVGAGAGKKNTEEIIVAVLQATDNQIAAAIELVFFPDGGATAWHQRTAREQVTRLEAR